MNSFPATRALEALAATMHHRRLSSKTRKVAGDCCVEPTAAHMNKRTYDLADMYQAASAVDDVYALDFPTIEWCSDDEEDATQQLSSIRKEYYFISTIPSKRRKRQRDDKPYLMRSKALTNDLMILGSSADYLSKSPSSSSSCLQYLNSEPLLSKVSILDRPQPRDFNQLSPRMKNRPVSPSQYKEELPFFCT